jgi:hypothetical protein
MHKILNNFFDKKEIETIINFVDYLININEGVVYSATGRKLIGLDNLDKTIIQKVEKYVKEIYNVDIIVKDIGFMRFSKQYGKPKLLPHKDDYACEVVFDYQLRTNKKWDLFIEGKRIELNDNDAVCFEGEKEAHWREKTIFNDNEYVDMICFNCIGKDHWRHNSINNPKSEIDIEKEKYETFKKWGSVYNP